MIDRKRGILLVIVLLVAVGLGFGIHYMLAPKHAIPSRDLLSQKPDLLTFYDQGVAAEKEIAAGATTAQPFLTAGTEWATIASVSNDPQWYHEALWVYQQGDQVLQGKNSIILMNMADTQSSLGQYDDAKKSIERALELSPGEPAYYQALIDLMRYKLKASPDDILAVYTEAIKRIVGAGAMYISRAAYYRDIGRFDDARADIELAHTGGALDAAHYAAALQELQQAKKQ